METDWDAETAPELSPVGRGLLHDTRFRRFALAKTLQLSGQNALIYGLFIAFIAEQDTYLAGSAFVLAATLPSVLLSLPGGVVADRLPNKLVMIGVQVVRVLIVSRFLGSSLSIDAVCTHGSARSRSRAAWMSKSRIAAPRSTAKASRRDVREVSRRPTTKTSSTVKPRSMEAATAAARISSAIVCGQRCCHDHQPPASKAANTRSAQEVSARRQRHHGTTLRRG